MYNKLLLEQLEKFYNTHNHNPSDNLTFLFEAISKTYDGLEKDNSAVERYNQANLLKIEELKNKLRTENERDKMLHKKLSELLFNNTSLQEYNESVVINKPENLLQIADELASEASKQKAAEQKLKDYLATLESANKELDQFAYVVSHDLKAPLRAIVTLTNWIEEDETSVLSEESRQHFETLKGRIVRMENLINGILQYSKASKSVKLKAVDTEKTLRELEEGLQVHDNFSIIYKGKFPVLYTEEIKIEQIFANLISNAVKYNDKPKGVLEIEALEMEECCQFSFKDNGPGIDPKYHHKIFQIFQTLEARDSYESTGIGLSIVKKIIEEKGGKIWIESKEGEGARFVFTWPKEINSEKKAENGVHV